MRLSPVRRARSTAGLMRGGPEGMWPKWRSTRALTSSGSTSPATTSTALAAPYQVSNQVRTSSSEAAFRSSIEPMVEWS